MFSIIYYHKAQQTDMENPIILGEDFMKMVYTSWEARLNHSFFCYYFIFPEESLKEAKNQMNHERQSSLLQLY